MEEPLGIRWRKSSYSGNGGGDCVEVGAWRTSSYSSNGGGECVEAGHAHGSVVVRDTKDRDAGMLTFGADAWNTFVASLK